MGNIIGGSEEIHLVPDIPPKPKKPEFKGDDNVKRYLESNGAVFGENDWSLPKGWDYAGSDEMMIIVNDKSKVVVIINNGIWKQTGAYGSIIM